MILYGTRGNYKDVTSLARKHLLRNDCICIPPTDHQRARVFGDPVPGVLKHVKVIFPLKQTSTYPSGTPARIAKDYDRIIRSFQEYYLSVVAVTQSEARFLREWLEFHLEVGVEHFYIYDNRSPDNTHEVLLPYIERGLVTYKTWKGTNPLVYGARQAGYQAAKKTSQWVAMIDTDEFITPAKVSRVPYLLRKYEGYGALAMNWQMFGTSGVNKVPADKLMLECLTKSNHPTDTVPCEWVPGQKLVVNYTIKVIVNSKYATRVSGAHRAIYTKGAYLVNSKGQELPNKATVPICIDDIQLNHYFFRDRKFLREVKLERRNRWLTGHYDNAELETMAYYNKYDKAYSMFTNLSAQRFVPAVRKRMGLT